MPTANPLEQFRRRMQSHASPAAFAAAAEEHRRAGRFAEAIAVCRDGLDRYPAYASARVTLGRALLDSGDVVGAIAELELAVAQAPDNLAAARALEAARLAHDESPAAPTPPPADPLSSAPLHDSGAGDAVEPTPPWHEGVAAAGPPDAAPPADLALSVVDGALHLGADGPQEFGLGPDWLPTGPGVGPDSDVPPRPVEVSVRSPLTGVSGASGEAKPLQGEEHAGIWPAPPVDRGTSAASSGAPVHSWASDPAWSGDSAGALASTSSIWDEPTIESPLPTLPPTGSPVDTAAATGSDELSADPGATGQWSGIFIEPVDDGAAPAVFNGWDDAGPSGREVPTWSDAPAAEPVTSAFTVPGLWEAPAAGEDAVGEWQVGQSSLPPASHTVEWHAAAPAVDPALATPEAMGEWTIVTAPAAPCVDDAPSAVPTTDAAAADPAPALVPSMWEGSVASAVDEVFARAAHAATPDHQSLEPPMHPSNAVRDAMADTAVEATLEDVAQQGEFLSPALITLQQMLDAVRARRAALHADMER